MSDIDSAAQQGPRELKPVQFFGGNTSAALGVDGAHDMRPLVEKVEDNVTDIPGEVRPSEPETFNFKAEPGEPGVTEAPDPDDDDGFLETPMSILDDAPPVDDDLPAADAEEQTKSPEAQPDEE